MGIEGQFMGLTARTRTEVAFASSGRRKGYLYDIRRFPMLEKDQEYRLAKRWREQGDRDAADQLITSHLRLAAKIAMGYRGYGLPIGEIVSEDNVGLMQALNRFEPERGFRFATYAMWWIRASIQDYILRSWSLVKIGTTANRVRESAKSGQEYRHKGACGDAGGLERVNRRSRARLIDGTPAPSRMRTRLVDCTNTGASFLRAREIFLNYA
jgi:RNA polymerase sigma-32 factor